MKAPVIPSPLMHKAFPYPGGDQGHSSMVHSSFNPKTSFQSISFRKLPALNEALCYFLTWAQWISWFLIKVTVDDSHLISIRYIIMITDFFTRIVNALHFLMCINYRSKVKNLYWIDISKTFSKHLFLNNSSQLSDSYLEINIYHIFFKGNQWHFATYV